MSAINVHECLAASKKDLTSCRFGLLNCFWDIGNMSFQSYPIPTDLSLFIDGIWTFEQVGPPERFRILPDGGMDILIKMEKRKNTELQPSIWISGMMPHYEDRSVNEDCRMIGVRFKAGQFSKFTNRSLAKTTGKTIAAAELIPDLTDSSVINLKRKVPHSEHLKTVLHWIYRILEQKKRENRLVS